MPFLCLRVAQERDYSDKVAKKWSVTMYCMHVLLFKKNSATSDEERHTRGAVCVCK